MTLRRGDSMAARQRATTLVVALAALTSTSAGALPYPHDPPGQPPSQVAASASDARRLEVEALAAIGNDALPFSARVELLDRVHAAQAGETAPEVRERLLLLWLRTLRWTLAAIPRPEGNPPSEQEWLDAHQSLAIFSEPAGQWLIVTDVIWKVHDENRLSAVADEIAWLAVENGLPGECEGYVPCYAQGLNMLDAEYLRRHPRGAHVEEAVTRVRESCEQSIRLLAGPDASDFLDPKADCGELQKAMALVRNAVAQSAAPSRAPAVAAIDRLLVVCR